MLYYQGRKTIALAAKRRRNGASTKRRRVRRENLPSLKLKGKKVIFAQRIFWENALASSKRERERLVFFCASDCSIIRITYGNKRHVSEIITLSCVTQAAIRAYMNVRGKEEEEEEEECCIWE